jgi:hypothetical protein
MFRQLVKALSECNSSETPDPNVTALLNKLLLAIQLNINIIFGVIVAIIVWLFASVLF